MSGLKPIFDCLTFLKDVHCLYIQISEDSDRQKDGDLWCFP